MCIDLLGSDDFVSGNGKCDISLQMLQDRLMTVPPDVSQKDFEIHVRAHVLFYLGTILIPARCNQYIIPLMYLGLFQDISKIKNFAWGAAVLCNCLSNIREFKRLGNEEVAGNLPSLFLVVFLGSYLPGVWKDVYGIEEFQLKEYHVAVQVSKKLAIQSKNRKRYKEKIPIFETLQSNDASNIQIVFQPFRRVPLPDFLKRQWIMVCFHTRLICFEKVMNHNPQLCLEKLGLRSDEMNEFEILKKTKCPKLRTSSSKVDYNEKQEKMVLQWNERKINAITRNFKEYEFEVDESESEAGFNRETEEAARQTQKAEGQTECSEGPNAMRSTERPDMELVEEFEVDESESEAGFNCETEEAAHQTQEEEGQTEWDATKETKDENPSNSMLVYTRRRRNANDVEEAEEIQPTHVHASAVDLSLSIDNNQEPNAIQTPEPSTAVQAVVNNEVVNDEDETLVPDTTKTVESEDQRGKRRILQPRTTYSGRRFTTVIKSICGTREVVRPASTPEQKKTEKRRRKQKQKRK